MVIDTLEEAEETGFLPVKLVVRLVDHGSDTADGPVTTPGQKEPYSGVIVKGIFLGIELGFLLADQGGDPEGIIGVYLPGELDEVPYLPPGSYRLHTDGWRCVELMRRI
jgi:hypothetical protein